MAKSYGVTPWGKWFIEVLDSYSMGARLGRGKTYANTGKVVKIEFAGGAVKARVKGRSSPYYSVNIGFSPLKDAGTVFALAEKDPMILARIAAGELPLEFLESLKAKGIEIIPRQWGEMTRSCSCPDWGDPCKHMAAVYYIIAREIDSDPHLLFRLRGIDLVSHFGASIEHSLKPPFELIVKNESKTDEVGGNSEATVFEYALPVFENYLNFIQSLLPVNPSFSDRDFSVTLSQFYHHVARSRVNSIFERGEESEGEDESGATWRTEHRFSKALWSATVKPLLRVGSSMSPATNVRLVMQPLEGEAEEFSLSEASLFFLSFAEEQGTYGYRFLFRFFRFIRAVEMSSAYTPVPYVEEKGETLEILWQPLMSIPQIKEAMDSLSVCEPGLFMIKKNPRKWLAPRSAIDLLSCAFLTERMRALEFSVSGGNESFRDLQALFFHGKKIGVSSPALRSLPLAIDRWLSVFSVDFSAWRYRFLLKEKKARVAVATQEALEFSLSMSVLVNDKAVPLKDAVEKTGDLGVLKAPTALSGYLGEIRTLSQKASVTLSSDRLVSFLDEAAILLSRLGVEIILPKSLHKELKPRLVLRGEAKKSTASLTSYLGLGTLLNYEWSIAIGDTLLSPAEFEKLVKGNKALVSFRDGYVRLDPKETAALLKNAQGSKKLGALDVLKTWFIGDTLFSSDAECMVSNLVGEKDFSVPATLSATLRPYQERGFRWVCSLLSSGFGCILADDMGLGKTIQAITVLLSLKEQGLIPGGTLVIAPAALLANWEKEIERFAPSLCVRLFHGTGRSLTSKADVYLTTYQTAVRTAESLNEKRFSLLIADEAHLMKNAQTRAARTVKSLIVPFRLALSGTPVENRLEDLRSLFDFVIPGYLGTPEAFKKEFRVPIEVDRRKDVATRLRDLTAPFLLRRLKTDKTIITDLPEKITINEYSALSKEQAALYESLVQKGMEESQKAVEPKDRSALILKLLTSLKQVCDHPRVYDKESPPISELSGKCGLLMTLLEEILRNREKVLIFSQYVESLKTLESMIASELGEKPILYYGGMNQTKRNEAVHSFQNDSETRIMLVSLKAGGLGLNLTAASRVIHFDLWYNPAVEQQATDRAFRIGQAKNVFVHRFVTRGTFEEKIDAMLTSRQELADMTVSSGETWLARMSHEELQALFSAVKG